MLKYEQAREIIEAAHVRAAHLNLRVSVAVVDAGGVRVGASSKSHKVKILNHGDAENTEKNEKHTRTEKALRAPTGA